jgi:LPXTG-motif cell wall-anchored protein
VLAVAGLAVLAMSVLLGYFWRRRRRALVSAPGLVG